MIIKVKSFKRPEFKRLLNYMMHDDNRLFDDRHKSFLITHNLKGNRIEHFTSQFVINESFRKRKRKDSVILTHEIISFHKGDSEHITIGKLEEIAREYISKRNPNGMYVAVPHFDKEHYHIHICASGIEYREGKSLRMSKPNFLKFKKDIQNFQIEKFPELSKSLVNHNGRSKTKKTEKEYQAKLRTGRATKKESLVSIIDACLKESNSKLEFLNKLKSRNLSPYLRSGKLIGVIYEKVKFRFSRLGIPTERFEKLNISLSRSNELGEVRRRKERPITRNL